mmetsp:Transcript_18540/g.74515  ORF Transcript_18540/g.74515 Transcript_18540/m.74515 type:complete len:118 (+) Transcript_18540:1564-1917(+)
MSDRCSFHEADFAQLHKSDKIPSELRNELRRGFDLIVCNPPYYSTKDQLHMSTSSRKHEPRMGLITDGGSYKCYEDICRYVKQPVLLEDTPTCKFFSLNPQYSSTFTGRYESAGTRA